MKKAVIGLTGSTGAGKSTVAKVFAENGFIIIDADRVSRDVTKKGSPVLNELSNAFGSDVILKNGELDRKLVAKRAFSDREQTDKLNSIVHPAVIGMIDRQVADCLADGVFPVIDAPLLFEAGCDRLCDLIVSVIAPIETRCKRIMERDNLKFEEAMLRIGAQHNDSFYTVRSDYVIENTGTIKELEIKAQQIADHISGADTDESR